MKKLIFSLLLAITIRSTRCNDILFSENHVKIIAKKSLDPVTQAYRSTTNSIIIQIARAQLRSENNKILMQCTNSASSELKKSYEKIEHIVQHPDRVKRHTVPLKRVKRGFNVLGELLSDITGNPSPSEFKHLKILVKDLQSLTNDEVDDIKNLHDIQTTEHKSIQLNFDLINKVNTIASGNKNQLDNDESDVAVCDILDNLVESVKDEVETVLEIESKSTQFLPSRSMFPQKRIEKTISNLSKQDDILKPYFLTGNKLEEFYSLKSTLTSIHKNEILSIAMIPMINPTKTMSMKSMSLRQKTNNHILTIEAVAKTRLTKIAIDPNERYFNLISEHDLEKCNKLENRDKYICDHRFIEIRLNQLNSKNPCLAYEIEQNDFVLTCEMKFNKKCTSGETSEHTANFSLISLPDSCSLDSDNIYIHKLKHSNAIIQTSFKILDIPPQLLQTQISEGVQVQNTNTSISTNKKFDLQNEHFLAAFNKTIHDNHKLHTDKLKKIHSDSSLHSYITYALISASVVGALIAGCCLCRPNIPIFH